MWEKLLHFFKPEGLPEDAPSKGFRLFLIITGTLLSVIILILIGIGTYAKIYQNRVYPGVKVGGYDLGGLKAEEVKSFVENIDNRYAKEGIKMAVTDAKGMAHDAVLATVTNGETAEQIMQIDSDELARQALGVGRGPNPWLNAVMPLYYRLFSEHTIATPLAVHEESLLAELHGLLKEWEDSPQNATISFEKVTSPAKVVPERAGKVFNYSTLVARVKSAMEQLSFDRIAVAPETFVPTITAANVQAALPRLSLVLNAGELNLNYVDPKTQVRHDWTITPFMVSQWVEARRDADNTIIFALNKEKVMAYLEREVSPLTDVSPAEAKFAMKNGKVEEFTASRTGLALSTEKTYNDIDTAIRARNYETANPLRTVALTVDIVEPTVKTADVNDMGITDIVGVGVSSFKGSHVARIKNVARAVELLNGVLIKPGEIFSTAHYVGPITPENGYLPELVIKGNDASQKEVGGGMCQIGTTLFRMAMNSAMPITERRNHSLVVNYYADPVNGNPGTDATIYDPIVDFKFENDTGNYLLLQTDMNMKTLQLTFTLWGKPDGRKGSYTHPTVSKWIPTGPDVNVAVTDGTLKPGEKNCQPQYKGAVASFTYTRYTSSSEKIDQVFTSYYRPLPKTCRVGVEPSDPCLATKTCFATASSTPVL